MCDMYKMEPDQISLPNAKKVLDFLARKRFLIVYITGGEPTLHPEIVKIVEYSNKLGLVTAMTTNGTASRDLLLDLKNAGLYLLSVSLDHWDPLICEKIRRHKDIMIKQVKTIEFLKKIRLKTYALAFLNPILVEDGVEHLIDYVNNTLKVPFSFCYPTISNNNTFSLGGSLSKELFSSKLKKSIQTILRLKKEGRSIGNLLVYIEDIVNYYEKKSPNFYCKGGEDVIYVDWHGDVYPCFLKGERLFNILNGENSIFLKNIKCNDCLINCFREPSFLTQMFSPLSLLAKEFYFSYPAKEIYR